MKIPLFYIPKTKFKKILHIQRRFKSDFLIFPIGCDCHPAHMLERLDLRKFSLPFDWLYTTPNQSIAYITDNIKNNFKYFLQNLQKNERGHFISRHYPSTEFIHEKELDKPEAVQKFDRRIERFLDAYHNEKIIFIHNFPVAYIHNDDELSQYLHDVKSFLAILKNNSTLHIYLRYDDDFNENDQYAEQLFTELKKLNIAVVKYNREYKKHGMWGLARKYPELLENLGICIQRVFLPKIFIR